MHARWTSRAGKGIGQYDAERIYNEPAVINHSPQFGLPACTLWTHRRSNTQSRPVMYKGDFKMCSYLGAAEHLNMNCPRGPGTPKPCKTNAFEGGPEAPGTVHIHMFGGANRIPDRNVRGGDSALVVLVLPPPRHALANKRGLGKGHIYQFYPYKTKQTKKIARLTFFRASLPRERVCLFLFSRS